MIKRFFITLILFIQALYGEGTEDCDSGFWHLKKYNFDKALYFLINRAVVDMVEAVLNWHRCIIMLKEER